MSLSPVLCFVLFCFSRSRKKNLFHSIHSNSTFNIKITFLYVDTQQIRKMKLTSYAFDYYLANKIYKCGEEKKMFQSSELEIRSAKYET